MASETLIRTALKLAKQLGANTSKFMGTKSNVSFLGSGPKDGMLFQKDINPESFASIGIKKVLPDLETSMSYLTGGKLNDIQTNKLIDNMSVMLDVMDPLAAKNVVDASSKFGGGLESLEGLGLKNLDNVRAKSGIGERQATEVASDAEGLGSLKSGKRMLDEDEIAELDLDIGGLEYTNDFDGTLASANKLRKERAEYIRDMEMEYKKGNLDPGPGEANREKFLRGKFDEMEASGDKKLMTRDEIEELSAFENTSPIQKTPFDEAVEYNAKPEDVVQNLVDQKFGVGYFDNVGENTAKRGSAREFLVEALKKENPDQTTFADIVDAADVKFITEGGGGQAGDPLALVDKYFGPRIREMLPSGASSEEIAIFTERVLTKVRDASGLKPGDPRFDRMTARFVEDFARGGLAKILEV